jgi:hypothetical protein
VFLFVGMYRRKRLTQCLAFSAYVAAATVFSFLYLVYPAYNTPELFVLKQGIYDSLLFGMTLELSYKAFAAFSGIASQARAILASLVAGSSIILLALTPPNQQYADIGRYQPGITTAGIWCLTFVALLIVRYQIPVPSFTRAIFLGYIPYQLIFVVVIDLTARLGWSVIQNLNVLNAAAYDGAVGYLAYNAWKED